MAITVIDKETVRRQIITYDLEWKPGSLEIRLASFYDGERFQSFTDVGSFLRAVMATEYEGAWIFAHWGGMADFQFLLEWFLDNPDPSVSIEASFSGASAIIVHVRKGDRQWHFIDSVWLFRDKLENIGRWIGMGKTGPADPTAKMTEDQKKDWYANAPIAVLRAYNERDCLILHKAITGFEDVLHSMGSELQMTIASCGLRLFRRRYLREAIDTDDRVNNIAREAYHASRVEVIQRECTNAFYYDVNSSFPYSMTLPCPGEYLGSSRRLRDGDDMFIARARITVPDCYLPPLPYRVKGRVFFPIGTWEAWITSIDLRLVEERGGRVEKIFEVHRFAPFDDLAEYIRDVYARRVSSKDPFNRTVYKYLMNCLYGKFAEEEIKTSLRINPGAKWLRHNRRKIRKGDIEQLFPGAWLEDRSVDVPHMHVPISAHITAHARKTLSDLLWKSLDMGGKIYYCDTDGFCTTAVLPTGDKLGEIKLEKRVRAGEFIAPKVYRLEGEILEGDTWKQAEYVKAKGFRKLTADELHRLVEGEAIKFERMTRIREGLRVASRGKTDFRPREGKYTKQLQNQVRKRVFDRSGDSRPWTMKELREKFGD